MDVDYIRKVTDGVCFLTHLGSKSYGLKGSQLLARRSHGWKSPHTFSMESSKRYCRRCVLPKIDLQHGRAEYSGALPKVLAFSEVPGNTPKLLVCQLPTPPTTLPPPKKTKVDARRKPRKQAPHSMMAQTLILLGDFIPCGERLLKHERNLAMPHAPRTGQGAFFWDWNSHGGCARCEARGKKHDSVSGKNMHCAIESELIRRGAHKNRPSRVLPEM